MTIRTCGYCHHPWTAHSKHGCICRNNPRFRHGCQRTHFQLWKRALASRLITGPIKPTTEGTSNG